MPATVTAQLKQLVETPIGVAEIKAKGEKGSKVYIARNAKPASTLVKRPVRRLPPEELVGRF